MFIPNSTYYLLVDSSFFPHTCVPNYFKLISMYTKEKIQIKICFSYALIQFSLVVYVVINLKQFVTLTVTRIRFWVQPRERSNESKDPTTRRPRNVVNVTKRQPSCVYIHPSMIFIIQIIIEIRKDPTNENRESTTRSCDRLFSDRNRRKQTLVQNIHLLASFLESLLPSCVVSPISKLIVI